MWAVKDIATVGLSSVAFLLSIATAWFTVWRRGNLYMTQPSVIYFGADPGGIAISAGGPRVYLRATMFSSGKRGYLVESLYVRLRRGETIQTFNIWVFGEKELARGSGLYVGEQGVASNHHFLLPADGTQFRWLEGEYVLEVYANLILRSSRVKVREARLALDGSAAAALLKGDSGVFFDWSPESREYHRHVRPALPPLPSVAA